jgi:hypothetical protein
MASPRASTSSQRWTEIGIGLLFVVVLQAGAIALFAYFVFDTCYTCDRARDSCQVERLQLFWGEVTQEFKLSELRRANWVPRARGGSHVALEMAGGAPGIRIPATVGEELAARLGEFIADPVQPRFHHVAGSHVGYLLSSGLLQLLALIILYATASEVIKRQRRRAAR